jgi:predicted membrane protein
MEINLGAGESNLNLADLSLRTLRMNTGAGQVDVNLGGTLEDFRLDTGAGEINLNLAHAWEQDTEGRINGGIGSITVLLPSSTGVQVTVRQGIGSVDAPGFTRDGNSYTNDAYGESEVTLDLTIEGGIGEVNLREGG